MTRSWRSLATALQYVGLLGSVLAVAASYATLDTCMAPLYLQGALIALVVDALAIWVAPESVAVGAAIAKIAVVLLFTVFLLVSCAAPPPTYVAPMVPESAGASLLLFSCVPSLLGAAGRRLTR